jgi:hypothetical protein
VGLTALDGGAVVPLAGGQAQSKEAAMSDTLGLFIHDGVLSFDPDSIATERNLKSWLENMIPEDLMSGRIRIDIPMRISSWGDDGPTLHVGDQIEGGGDESDEDAPEVVLTPDERGTLDRALDRMEGIGGDDDSSG